MEVRDIEVVPGFTVGDFLLPISEGHPVGRSLREDDDPIYGDIQLERTADDPNLPLGVWKREPKLADWQKVSELCVEALLRKSKDLQIVAWLVESQSFLHGAAGMGRSLILFAELADRFWDDVYPLMEDDDVEFRTNIVDWLNSRLQIAISVLQISDPISADSYTWMDWERALIDGEQDPKPNAGSGAGQGLGRIRQSIDATDIEFYQELWGSLFDCEFAIDHLSAMLEKHLSHQAPSIAGLRDLVTSMKLMLEKQTEGRAMGEEQGDDELQAGDSPAVSVDNGHGTEGVALAEFDMRDRQQAYKMLAQAADYLVRDDPHSPVPYLIYKAIDFGRLNTAELYEELFVRCNGNINIFDLLGIESETKKR